MKFGLLLAGQFKPGESPRQHLTETLEQVRLARAAGFDSIWMVQHFLADYQYFQPIPFLARIAGESGSMTVGTAVLLLPFYPPVALAEELATLDVILDGRLVVGVGTGYREDEFAAFGIPPRERVSRFEETITLLRRLWSGDEVDFAGRHFTLKGARLRLLPVQPAGPPVWVGAGGDQGIQRAARIGDAWMPGPFWPLGALQQKLALYRQALLAQGHPAKRAYPLLREACVAPDREAAYRAARPVLASKFATYASWGHQAMREAAIDDVLANACILGDPETCIEQIQRYRDALSVDHMILRVQWPGLEQRVALRSIELLGERVLPWFRTRRPAAP